MGNKIFKGLKFPGMDDYYVLPEAVITKNENGIVEIESYLPSEGEKAPYVIPITSVYVNDGYSYCFADGYVYDSNEVREAVNNNRVVMCQMVQEGSLIPHYLVYFGDDFYAYFSHVEGDYSTLIEIAPESSEVGAEIFVIRKRMLSDDGPLGRKARTITSLEEVKVYGPGWYHKWFNRNELPAGAFEGQWTFRTGYYGDDYYFQIIMPTVGVTTQNYEATCELRRQYDSQRGGWQPWEWVNPPMEPGVEYRTTERYNGKPVYTKYIDFGVLPNTIGQLKEVAISDDVVQVISFGAIQYSSGDVGYAFPLDTKSVLVQTYDGILYTEGQANTGYNTASFLLKYIYPYN